MHSYHIDHLQFLETEAIHVMREVAAEPKKNTIRKPGNQERNFGFLSFPGFLAS